MTLLDLTGVVEQSSDAANNVKGGTPGERALLPNVRPYRIAKGDDMVLRAQG
jgi:hypothetical protein